MAQDYGTRGTDLVGLVNPGGGGGGGRIVHFCEEIILRRVFVRILK